MGIVQSQGCVADANSDALMASFGRTHPDVGLCLARDKTHVAQAVRKFLMPPQAAGAKTTKSLVNDKEMSLERTKFGTCNDADLLLCLSQLGGMQS